MTVQLCNRLFLPSIIVLIINRDLRAVPGVICDAHFRSHSPVSKSGSYLPFYFKKNLGGGRELRLPLQ